MGRRKQPLTQLTTLPLDSLTVGAAGEGVADSVPQPSADAVARLATSLDRHGLREPVLVAEDAAGGFRLVLGLRRVLAARLLGWNTIHCVLLGPEHRANLSAIEALQRGEEDPWSLAEALQRLHEAFGWTQTQLGTIIGRNRDYVATLLAVTRIRPEARALLAPVMAQGTITLRHLRYVGRTASGRQMQTAKRILERGLSSKALEAEQRLRSGPRTRQHIKVRTAIDSAPSGPVTGKEWRRYHRSLGADLRRIDQQETKEVRKATEKIRRAREHRERVRSEARHKRGALERELRRAQRELERLGEL